MANKFKKVRCVCEKCNKPFSASVEMEHPLCKVCAEQKKFDDLGIRKVAHMVRTPEDVRNAELADLDKVQDALTRKRIIDAQNKRRAEKDEPVVPMSKRV